MWSEFTSVPVACPWISVNISFYGPGTHFPFCLFIFWERERETDMKVRGEEDASVFRLLSSSTLYFSLSGIQTRAHRHRALASTQPNLTTRLLWCSAHSSDLSDPREEAARHCCTVSNRTATNGKRMFSTMSVHTNLTLK